MAINIVGVFWKPWEAIEETKKDKNLVTLVIYLIIAAILTAISFAILIHSSVGSMLGGMKGYGIAGAAVCGFLIVLIGGLLGGLYYTFVLKALKVEADYLSGVATITHTVMPASLGMLILSVFSLLPSVGVFIGLLIALVFFALSAGTLYNATREFFETDMITAFVAVYAFTLTIVIAIFMFILPMMGLSMKMMGGTTTPQIPSSLPYTS